MARRYRRFRRFARGGRRSFRRGGLGISKGFLIGAAAAFVLPENDMIEKGALIGACVPMKLPMGLKGISQGYVLGQMLQKQFGIGNFIGGGMSSRLPNIV